MLSKFRDGLIFGVGFSLAFILFWHVYSFFILPQVIETQFRDINTEELTEIEVKDPFEPAEKTSAPFHELGLDEQINQASVIALAGYEKGSDGKYKTIIKEFLKKTPGTDIYYDVGDQYKFGAGGPSEKYTQSDGEVIFFVGSPAEMRMSVTYSGERIMGLGDLPVKLLREKCKK